MRKLSAARPVTLRPAPGNLPAPGNPPPPARQPSGTSPATLRPRQRSATDTATLRDQHGNPPAPGNPPRRAARAISARTAGRPRCPGQQRRDDAAGPTWGRQQHRDDPAPLHDQLKKAALGYGTSNGPTMGFKYGMQQPRRAHDAAPAQPAHRA